MWIVVLIDICLVINLMITVTAIALTLRPEGVVGFARRHLDVETFFEGEGGQESAMAVARLWGRWMWVILLGWGFMTGFLMGLYWDGAFFAQSLPT